MLSNDYREIIELPKTHHVEFVVVGAYAMGAYGHVRVTGDLDIWVRPDTDKGTIQIGLTTTRMTTAIRISVGTSL